IFLRVGSARALKRSPTSKRICKSLLAYQAGVAAGGAGRFRDPPLSAVAAARLATVSSDRLRPRLGRVEPTAPGTRVSPLELFYDLVFVYAFLNVTTAASRNLTLLTVLASFLLLT